MGDTCTVERFFEVHKAHIEWLLVLACLVHQYSEIRDFDYCVPSMSECRLFLCNFRFGLHSDPFQYDPKKDLACVGDKCNCSVMCTLFNITRWCNVWPWWRRHRASVFSLKGLYDLCARRCCLLSNYFDLLLYCWLVTCKKQFDYCHFYSRWTEFNNICRLMQTYVANNHEYYLRELLRSLLGRIARWVQRCGLLLQM